MTPLEIPPLPGALRVSTYLRGGYRVAALSGELDFASGLAVLVGTNRRARLLRGVLRLAAPAPPVIETLRITGLDLKLDVFPTVSAAIIGTKASPRIPDGG